MTRRPSLSLLDQTGHPFSPHIDEALMALIPRLQSASTVFRDECVLTEILEEAGRRLVRRERRSGPIENLAGYAWVTVRTVATSWLRQGSGRLAQQTLESAESEVALAAVPAQVGTPEQVEHRILLREILAQLTPEERLVCVWKQAGWSTREIAARRGTSVDAINMVFMRMKQNVRRLLGMEGETAGREVTVVPPTTLDLESAEILDIEAATLREWRNRRD